MVSQGHNCIKFRPSLIFFGTTMTKTTELCKVQSMSTSPNLCHHTTVLNTDIPNCCIMLSCCLQ